MNMGVSKTSDHIEIKIKIQNPSQESPVFSEAPNEDFKDINVFCILKIEIEPKFGIWVYHYQIPVTITKSRLIS